MAKRQGSRRGTARRIGSSGRGTSGQTVASLAALAAVLGGGTALYRYTAAHPAEPAESSSSRSLPAQSSPLRRHPEAIPTPSAGPSSSPSAPGLSPAPAKASAPSPESSQPAIPGKVPVAPFGTSEEVFESGARLYAANCAGCHGRPGKNGSGPLAAQFWDRTSPAGTQAIAQPAGALYQATAHGNLADGMPSYAQRLTDTQLWDLALLMKSAHDDLPEPVVRLLRGVH